MRKTALLIAFFFASFSPPAWAQTPLKLGLLLDMSGPFADITGEGTVAAARMAVDDFGGKVLGRPIEIVFADQQNKPDIAASLARQWFDNEGVEAIFDVAASAPALAVNEIAKQRIETSPAGEPLFHADHSVITRELVAQRWAGKTR